MKISVLHAVAFMLLVAACSVQSYGSVVYFDTANPNVQPGETISVAIFSEVITTRIQMDRISDTHGGTASNLWLNPEYHSGNSGTLVNSENVLIENAYSLIIPLEAQVSGNLYTFDYLVPNVLYGTAITIFADSTGGATNLVYTSISGSGDSYPPDSLTLMVVPEPASILFFLLGAVAVNCKKK